jgi:hypothetical protein
MGKIHLVESGRNGLGGKAMAGLLPPSSFADAVPVLGGVGNLHDRASMGEDGGDAMAETKTKPTNVAVEEFIAKVEDPQKRADSYVLIDMMRKITGEKPKMWGPSIVGFGSYHYKYASGHEGDSCIAAFSPRKAEFSIYLSPVADERRDELLAKLGKHRMGKGCLYVKRLEGLDMKVLEQLVRHGMEQAKSIDQASRAS